MAEGNNGETVRPGRAGSVPPGGRLVERDHEERLLDELLRGLRAGRSALVEVRGGPGAGRSALLRRAGELAAAAGVRVAGAQACWEETGVRHAVAAQLYAALAPRASPLVGELLRPGAEEDGALTGRLCRAFLAAARSQPLLVVVDDVQWADRESLRFLRTLARRLAGAPLLLVTARSDALPPGPGERIELCPLADPRVVARHAVDLAPLSAAGAGRVLAEALGEPVEPELAAAAALAADGNPAVLRAMAERFARPGRPAAQGREARDGEARGRDARDREARLLRCAGEAVRDRAVRTLAVLPEDLVEVLRAIAVCGPHGSPAMIAALASPRAVDTAQALELLAGSGLLAPGERPRFRAERAAEAALAGLGAERREHLFARAAELANRAALPDDALAGMLLGARVIGAPWAVAVLRREAARLRVAGDPAASVRLLRRALREPVGPRLRVELLTELGVLALPGSPESSDRFLRQALLAPADASAGPARVRAADLLVARGDYASAVPLIAGAGARPGVGDRERAALRALYWLARHGQDGSAQEPHRPEPAALPERPDDPAEAGAAAWLAALHGRDLTRARELARAALSPAAPDGTSLTARVAACHALLLTEDVAEAQLGLDAVLARAHRANAPAVIALALLIKALATLGEDRAEEAERLLERAEEALPERCWHPQVAPGVRAVRTLARLARGDLDGAERAGAPVRPEEAGGSMARAFLAYARGRVRLARGDGAGALGELRECGRLLLARQMANPALLPWRSASARALALTGDDAGAAELVAEERRLALAWGAPRTLARALRAAGDAGPEQGGEPGREPAFGTAAVRLLADGPASWQFRQALVAMGTAAVSGLGAIDSLLRSGLAPAGPVLRAGPPAPVPVPDPEPVPVPDPAPDPAPAPAPVTVAPPVPGGPRPVAGAAAPGPARPDLTAAERRVAALAAEGLANRVIAAELSVTLRTVELHLTKAYRKLGISGRPELARALGRDERNENGAPVRPAA
ncbi:AAA family ATPase [Kitasatospora sp. NPDC015120]|uniref:helix-turn-helix transcriptional regulator n=1 Tax=Kitasatospora sp. NPDC015120 TaxID=3364023 RepID=UPI0036F45CC2